MRFKSFRYIIYWFAVLVVFGYAMDAAASTGCVKSFLEDDEILCENFHPNSTLTVKINGNVIMTTQTDSNGEAWFYIPYNLKSGDLLEISDEVSTVSYMLDYITIEYVDVVGNKIIGTAPPSTSVQIVVSEEESRRTLAELYVEADHITGCWTADLNAEGFNLQHNHRINATVCDNFEAFCQCTTTDEWGDLQAAFNVHVPSDFVHVYNWPANSVLTLTIDDPDTSMEPDFEIEADVNASGDPFNIEFADSFDVQAGHLVTVSGGCVTKSHQVTNVVVDSVDVFNDTISGNANPGSTVETVDWSGAVPSLTTQADENGHWVTDYKTIDFDLLPEHSGAAVQDDEDGDRTTYFWSAQYVGEIVSYVGEVYVNETRVNHVPWKLMPNDRIRTQMSSNAEISLDVVPPVPIHGVMSGESSASVGVDALEEFKGEILMKIRELPRDREFKIKTPQSVTSRKGTELVIESETDFTRISMLEDSADVSTLDESETLELQELQSVTVTAEGIGEPQPLSLVDLDKFWKKLVISVASPIDLYVTDPLGRHVGVNANGNIVNEIPGATYSGPYQVPEVVTIKNPARGNYLTDLIATGAGPFHLEIAGTGLGDDSFHDRYSGEVEAGQVLSYQSSYQTDDPQQVTIDIKPGGFPNPVNPKSAGVIPVGIVSTDNFDATSVDPQTVTFGSEGTEATPRHYAIEDLDQDGDMDMIFHFETQDTGITCENTSAYLEGRTSTDQEIKGYDSVTTCKP